MNKDNYIIISRPADLSTLGNDGKPMDEDRYGDITPSVTEENIAEFWGDIEEMKPYVDDLNTFATDEHLRYNRRLKITADSTDSENVDIGDIVQIDNRPEKWVVRSFYDSEWKWQRTIITEYSS